LETGKLYSFGADGEKRKSKTKKISDKKETTGKLAIGARTRHESIPARLIGFSVVGQIGPSEIQRLVFGHNSGRTAGAVFVDKKRTQLDQDLWRTSVWSEK